jgi:hypothetical protein
LSIVIGSGGETAGGSTTGAGLGGATGSGATAVGGLGGGTGSWNTTGTSRVVAGAGLNDIVAGVTLIGAEASLRGCWLDWSGDSLRSSQPAANTNVSTSDASSCVFIV